MCWPWLLNFEEDVAFSSLAKEQHNGLCFMLLLLFDSESEDASDFLQSL